MKILKFESQTIANAEQIKAIAPLLTEPISKIVILPSIGDTTAKIQVIAEMLRRKESIQAKEHIQHLEFEYAELINRLLTADTWKQKGIDLLLDHFKIMWDFTKTVFPPGADNELLKLATLFSSRLIALYLEESGEKTKIIPAAEVIYTDLYGVPDTGFLQNKLRLPLQAHPEIRTFLTQGGICKNAAGQTGLLSQGSNYTACLIGAAIQADEIQLWSAGDKFHPVDPETGKDLPPIRQLNYEEAVQFTYFSGTYLHPDCVLAAKSQHIPVRLLSTISPESPGTLISTFSEKGKIKAVTAKDHVLLIKIKSLYRFSAAVFLNKVFETLAAYNVTPDLIATTETGMSVIVGANTPQTKIVNELGKYAQTETEENLTVVSVIGDFEWQTTECETAILDSLKNIPLKMICYGGSESSLSIVIKNPDRDRALHLLTKNLFPDKNNCPDSCSDKTIR